MEKKDTPLEEIIENINAKCDDAKAKSKMSKEQIDAVKEYVRTTKEMMPERIKKLDSSLAEFLQKGVADNFLTIEMPGVFSSAKVEKLMDTKEGAEIAKKEEKEAKKKQKAARASIKSETEKANKYQISVEDLGSEKEYTCTSKDGKISKTISTKGDFVEDAYQTEHGKVHRTKLNDGNISNRGLLLDGDEKVGTVYTMEENGIETSRKISFNKDGKELMHSRDIDKDGNVTNETIMTDRFHSLAYELKDDQELLFIQNGTEANRFSKIGNEFFLVVPDDRGGRPALVSVGEAFIKTKFPEYDGEKSFLENLTGSSLMTEFLEKSDGLEEKMLTDDMINKQEQEEMMAKLKEAIEQNEKD